MPTRAFSDFTTNMARARALLDLERTLPRTTDPEKLRADDVLRAAWMFAVGAMDTYFCDAYTDMVASALVSKQRHPAIILPDSFNKIDISIGAAVRTYPANNNWRWRMAVRLFMEDKNALQYERVKQWLNVFLTDPEKVWDPLLLRWLNQPGASFRLFATSSAAYSRKTNSEKKEARKKMSKRFRERFMSIVHRRHAMIHNCDMPRRSPLKITHQDVDDVLTDIHFIVSNTDSHMNVQYRAWLSSIGAPANIIAAVGY